MEQKHKFHEKIIVASSNKTNPPLIIPKKTTINNLQNHENKRDKKEGDRERDQGPQRKGGDDRSYGKREAISD